jgi:Asp-tRNA(Asn)/Glu-tRNA(Gln) amidotransferase A subunit family amidase
MVQTNCLTEMFIEDALDRAQSLDDHLSKTGETVGPLHGLPVSLKDQFCVAGYETIMGKLITRQGVPSFYDQQDMFHGSDGLQRRTLSLLTC